VSNRKLLLADDSITIQKVVNLTFADEGIEVFTFGDGDAAYENLSAVNPDIVLADVNMPGMNGYQICQSVRANEAMKDIPVVLLVGSFEPFDLNEADRVGANRYMTKPFSSIAELVATVKELLQKTTPANQEVSEPVLQQEPQPETSKEPESVPAPGRSASDDDIDSLYRQSFADTVELPRDEEPVIEFSDDDIDDEMIQTSYADPDADTVSGASFDEAEETDDQNVEQLPAAAAEEQPDTTDTEYVLSDSPEETAEPAEGAGYSGGPEASNGSYEQADVQSFHHDAAEPENKGFQFDEVDLLELPAVTGTRSYKFVTPEQAAEGGNREQIVSLSPELMDIIVQKVVDKLSEKY
jgi:DNA-binding response OmpR family regulator